MGNVGLISLAARHGPLSDVSVCLEGEGFRERGGMVIICGPRQSEEAEEREVDEKRGSTGSERLV